MKYLPYILKHLRKTWIRTGSTVLGMALCIFLICVAADRRRQHQQRVERRQRPTGSSPGTA